MSETTQSPFPVFGEEDTTASDLRERQVNVVESGLTLVRKTVESRPSLERRGLIVLSNTAALGTKKFVSNGPVAGGWHQVQLPGEQATRLLHLTFQYPEATEGERRGDGYVDYRLADMKVLGGTALPGKIDTVRVNITHHAGVHRGDISFMDGGRPFRVNDHDQVARGADDLRDAERLIANARAGLNVLLAPSPSEAGSAPQGFMPFNPGSTPRVA